MIGDVCSPACDRHVAATSPCLRAGVERCVDAAGRQGAGRPVPNDLVAMACTSDLAVARRWFASFESCSVGEPIDDFVGLGPLKGSTRAPSA